MGELRIAALFDIVVDHPESLPAVVDLRECLRYTNLHQRLAASFRQSIQDRLLHAGKL